MRWRQVTGVRWLSPWWGEAAMSPCPPPSSLQAPAPAMAFSPPFLPRPELTGFPGILQNLHPQVTTAKLAKT